MSDRLDIALAREPHQAESRRQAMEWIPGVTPAPTAYVPRHLAKAAA